MNLQQLLEQASQHHQYGRLHEAEQLYRQILQQQPDHAGALHYLGLIAHQVGRSDIAVELINRAIAVKPEYADAYYNLGKILKDIGQLEDSIVACRKAIALKPDYANAYSNLGNALRETGQLEDAIAAYRKAIALRPDYAETHNNMGNALRETGQLEEAIAAFQRAIALRFDFAEAYYNLGNALKDKGLLEEAIAAYRKAIALRFDFAEAHYNLGNALRDRGQLVDAIAAYQKAIVLRPDYAETHNNMGNALRETGQLEEAIAALQKAIALKPDNAEAHSNLGNALKDKGQLEQAVAAYQKAIALKPDFADAHWNMAWVLMLKGDFQKGLKEFEWRWKMKGFPSAHRLFSQPQWDGSDLNDRTILLHCEQGMGDSIQFSRYLPLVIKRGGKVIVWCPKELQRVLRSMDSSVQWLTWDQPLPPFDVHCPLWSLPHVFGTTLQAIPNAVPYLQADPALIEPWRKRMDGDSRGLKVGLRWAGNPNFKEEDRRSPGDLSLFAPLAKAKKVRFFSLQKGKEAQQTNHSPSGMELVDWTEELHDFADTAALMANLDLVISSDTSVAHLAGAMGKPVWVMLPYAPDWRWMLNREDSPWYPTMRLFRQPAWGDWGSVIQRVSEALQDYGNK